MSKNLWVALGIVALIAIVVLILASGGSPGDGSGDDRGDVTVGDGDAAPDNPDLADIVDATVRREGNDVVFEATMGAPIPKRIRNGSLEFRWDVSEGGDDTWIVSANMNLGPTAAITSQRTAYGASTIDDSLPGSITVDGETVRVTLRTADIEGFPTDFTWRLQTSLDGDRRDAASAIATDSAPDSGEGQIEG
ncbi:MAG TPA: hypothetical protein VG929_03150 [Actinomycetota bacterium]|nr:hypothetical protein [Actinomycetota bacterium]